MKFRRTSSHSNAIAFDRYPTNGITADTHQAVGQQDSTSFWKRLLKTLSPTKGWNGLLRFFNPSPEPLVKELRDRHGNISFGCYDPISREWTIVMTEDEARVWIEWLVQRPER